MNILQKPLITEKATDDSELHNRFTFRVDQRATKPQIKYAVESAYEVKVEAVRTMNVGAKHSTRYTKTGVLDGKTSGFKKAIVQVAEGDTIDLYENF